MLPQLKLPSFACKVKEVDGKPYIFDVVRKKFVILSPEEWVRQHFVNLLIEHYRYPRALFAIETGLFYHSLRKRSDIMVLGSDAAPFLLVECKAPAVKLQPVVFEQIARYNYTLRPKFMAVTNGMEHFCFRVGAGGNLVFLDGLPLYSEEPGF
ncbi:type I restriction enzyme HsdR N-terminal domain-containing protein [Ravibacter arvi]|uniref:Type I restriction enzyme HsdR N-terminal domain-containing protein n=1 Tax=Ravibacter arvi TaxID=2051041 RepID=A0ABP8M492_9BACT